MAATAAAAAQARDATLEPQVFQVCIYIITLTFI